ncbi:site-specific integrase [Enterococcus faecium]|uniref:tyrosine-type recombinase/integrase n=5 Tax=Enterococcus faecium TaxID=1352 RepID=UPI0021FA0766|nr:site-specific integrase [Enterococcus faecium]BDP90069.1 site-specific integrase [Enterococcus faecium]
MWLEKINDKKFKYTERYTDPLTEKKRKVSVTLSSNSRQAWNQANLLLNEKIAEKIKRNEELPLTFGELKTKWDEKYKPTVKESSYRTTQVYLSLISKYIKDDVLVKNVNSNLIQDMLDYYYFEKNLSYNYVIHLKTFTGMIFKFANRRYGLKYNPVNGVSLARKPKTNEEIKKEKDGYLSKEEVQMIASKQKSSHQQSRYSLITKFLFLTGLRYGELISLTESDYDGNKITVSGTYDYELKIKTTTKNTGSYRTIELSSNAKLQRELNTRAGYVYVISNIGSFGEDKNGNPISIQAYNQSLRAVSKELNIDKKVSSHMLRHSHISLLTELGIPLKAIMDRVGHEDSKTTLKIYTHTTKNMQNQLVEKLGKIEI